MDTRKNIDEIGIATFGIRPKGSLGFALLRREGILEKFEKKFLDKILQLPLGVELNRDGTIVRRIITKHDGEHYIFFICCRFGGITEVGRPFYYGGAVAYKADSVYPENIVELINKLSDWAEAEIFNRKPNILNIKPKLTYMKKVIRSELIEKRRFLSIEDGDSLERFVKRSILDFTKEELWYVDSKIVVEEIISRGDISLLKLEFDLKSCEKKYPENRATSVDRNYSKGAGIESKLANSSTAAIMFYSGNIYYRFIRVIREIINIKRLRARSARLKKTITKFEKDQTKMIYLIERRKGASEDELFAYLFYKYKNQNDKLILPQNYAQALQNIEKCAIVLQATFEKLNKYSEYAIKLNGFFSLMFNSTVKIKSESLINVK